jgi:hypothetical protein
MNVFQCNRMVEYSITIINSLKYLLLGLSCNSACPTIIHLAKLYLLQSISVFSFSVLIISDKCRDFMSPSTCVQSMPSAVSCYVKLAEVIIFAYIFLKINCTEIMMLLVCGITHHQYIFCACNYIYTRLTFHVNLLSVRSCAELFLQ